jgi:hypothetical protein
MACAGAASAQSAALQIGTTGLGVEAGFGLTEYLATRVSYGAGSYPYSIIESGIRYDTKAKASVGLLTLDLHPFRGVFRLSAGLGYNNTRIEGTADTEAGTIVINGVTYSTSQFGTVEGEIHFTKASPYVGFGWGNAAKSDDGLFFTVDFGVMYSPATGTVTGTCAPLLAAPVCAVLQTDLRAEAEEFTREVEKHKYYPVVRLGFGYRF